MASADQRPFRYTTRERLLVEMLRDIRGATSSDWKVLIMDEFTLKVMSTSCKMADVTEEGISLVEDINKRRQPMPLLDGVYFIQPSYNSVNKFIQDMSGMDPLYRRAYVFFSSSLPKELLQAIKFDSTLRRRIAGLKEVNLEYLTVDVQGFVTDHDMALHQLFGEREVSTTEFERAIDSIACRLSTVFASLKEFPVVRYRAPKLSQVAVGTAARQRDLIPTKVASALWDRLQKYRHSLADYPSAATCDLLLLDRSVDVVAPIIHDWSYGGMCFDLLPVDGNKYIHEVVTQAGRRENKTVFLDEHDAIWLELRDLFIAEAFQKVTTVADELASKSSLADRQDLSAKEMSDLIKTLPQYREQKDKVELHVNIATKLKSCMTDEGLRDVGKLEQGFVFDGGKTLYKDLAILLTSDEELTDTNKLRLLLIYAAMFPEKFDATKRAYWQKLAQLSDADMAALTNLEFLAIPVGHKLPPEPAPAPQKESRFNLGFGSLGIRTEKSRVRKDRHASEGAWELSRFYPVLQDLVEDLVSGQLSRELYPFVEEPHAASGRGGVQSVRAANSTWATRGSKGGDSQIGSMEPHSHRRTASGSSSSFARGRRLFVFVVGGMTRSELRSAHTLTSQLNREVVIGSTSLDTPRQFLEKLKGLSSMEEVHF